MSGTRPHFLLEKSHNDPVCGIDEVGRGPLAGPVVAACVYVPPHVYDLPFWAHVNDSKKLSYTKRLELDLQIKNHCLWGLGQASVDEIDRVNILNATFLAMERAYQAMNPPPERDPHAKACNIKNSAQAHPNNPPPERGRCLSVSEGGGGDFTGKHHVTPSGFAFGSPTSPFQGEDSPLALIDGNRSPRDFPIPVQCVIRGDATSLSIAAASIIAKVARDALMADLARDYPEYGWADNAGYGTPAHLAALALHGPCPHHRMSFAPVRNAVSSQPRAQARESGSSSNSYPAEGPGSRPCGACPG